MNKARPKDVVKYIDSITSPDKGNYGVIALKSKALYYGRIGIELLEIPYMYEIDIDKFYDFCNRESIHE
jgi:hypothetical protein